MAKGAEFVASLSFFKHSGTTSSDWKIKILQAKEKKLD